MALFQKVEPTVCESTAPAVEEMHATENVDTTKADVQQKHTVSVIVATYRREERLRQALESLTQQSYDAVEIVVVDDNADAEWNKTVQAIVADFPQVVYVCNAQNKGSATSRNIGIQAATGEYVTFLDDDDVYLPQKIERQVRAMVEAGADYGLTDLYLYWENGRPADRRIRKYIKKTDPASLMEYHLLYHMTGTDSFMFRRDYLLQIGCFDAIDVGDEYYLMHKAIRAGGKMRYLPGCDIRAHIHTAEGGLSSGQGKIDGENQLYLFKQEFLRELPAKSRRYVRMRHHAVIAFAYLRMHRWGAFVRECVLSFVASPVRCIGLFLQQL